LGSLLFPTNADHLLLTRIVTQPDAAESFSIYNPTNSAIDLSNYYICDDEEYYKMQTDGDMSPSSSIGGFTVQFPDIFIAPGDTLHIVLNEDYKDFYGENFVADLVMFGSSDSSLTGSMGFSSNKIDEIDELIILFKWDGESNQLIEDIDYFVWSSYDGIINVVNKTGIDSYADDTALDNQLYFETVAEQYYAYSRIGTDEIDETQTGGNGITNDNETSENFRISWEIVTLFNLGCTNIDAINYDINAEVDNGTCYFTTISDIINGSYLDQLVTTAGVIIDYFNITPFGGPHSITISDESSNKSLELTIWPDSWDEELDLLVQPPFFTKEIMITGTVGEYEGKSQIELSGAIIILDNNYVWNIPNLTIPDILNGLYDGQVITTRGKIVDYFDITIFNGPHAITIEDTNYNELELTIWPDYWDDTLTEYANCPYSRFEVEVTGIVNEYCKDTCNNFTTEISCNTDDDCMWDSGGCIEEVCEVKYTSQAYCEADDDCIWDEDDNECGKDCTLDSSWECSSLSRSISYGDDDKYDVEYYLSTSIKECSWQLEVKGITGVELINTNEISSKSVSFQDVLDGDYYHQSVMLEGVISDYFDITKYCGPHAVTISEEATGNSLELTMWDNQWSDELECLSMPPFFTKKVQVSGFVSEYEGDPQIQVCGDVIVLNENYDYQAEIVSIRSIVDGKHDNKIVACEGLVVDYFDVTVYNGPHALTIEDETGYKLELSIWPNTYDIANSTQAYLLQPPYNRYLLSTMGSVTEYEGEKQLSISGANSITVSDTINLEGTEYTGLMITFIIDTDYDDFVNDQDEFDRGGQFITDLADQLGISNERVSIIDVKEGSVILDINIRENKIPDNNEPSNDDLLAIIADITSIGEFEVEVQEIIQLSVNTATIKPQPYVIIPTLGEKLDYTYSYPKNSRVIIRLFDLSGRFVTSLVDKYYEESATIFRDDNQSSWDGRDQLGQIVPPGTYIMHIEAMNPVTGETQTDAAPVVVGVKN